MRTMARRVAAALIALVAATGAARADYPERNIEMIIPHAAGGGFDLYARAVGRVMEKHLPRSVKVIPQNITGAGSRRGTAALYRAAPDGYTIGIVSMPGAVEPQVLGEEVHYDLDRLTWLGAIDTGIYMLVVGNKTPYRTFEDLKRAGKPIFVATTGGSDLTNGKIAADAYGLEFKYLTGYKGAPEGLLAVTRGEADASMAVANIVAPYVANGDLRPLLVFQNNAKRAVFPDVPTTEDLGHPALAHMGLYRPFAAPPALPASIREILVTAVQKALRDPELADWSAKSGNPIDPETAEETAARYAAQKAFLVRYKHLLK